MSSSNWFPTASEERTPLGRRLAALRQQIIEAGEPLLDWEQVQQERDERRGARDGQDRQDNRAHWERRIAIPYRALTAAEKPRYWLWVRNVQQLIQEMREEHEQRHRPANWFDTLLAPLWDKAAIAIICVFIGFFGAVFWVLQAPHFQWLCV